MRSRFWAPLAWRPAGLIVPWPEPGAMPTYDRPEGSPPPVEMPSPPQPEVPPVPMRGAYARRAAGGS